jgi:hypothetical protein
MSSRVKSDYLQTYLKKIILNLAFVGFEPGSWDLKAKNS